MHAADWRELCGFYTSVGFSRRAHLAVPRPGPASSDGRCRAGRGRADRDRPLAAGELDEAIAQSEDAKTLIALLWLALERARRPALTGLPG